MRNPKFFWGRRNKNYQEPERAMERAQHLEEISDDLNIIASEFSHYSDKAASALFSGDQKAAAQNAEKAASVYSAFLDMKALVLNEPHDHEEWESWREAYDSFRSEALSIDDRTGRINAEKWATDEPGTEAYNGVIESIAEAAYEAQEVTGAPPEWKSNYIRMVDDLIPVEQIADDLSPREAREERRRQLQEKTAELEAARRELAGYRAGDSHPGERHYPTERIPVQEPEVDGPPRRPETGGYSSFESDYDDSESEPPRGPGYRGGPDDLDRRPQSWPENSGAMWRGSEGVPQSRPEPRPEEAPQSRPPEEAPQSRPEPRPEPHPEEAPQSRPQSRPEPRPEPRPEEAPQSRPQSRPEPRPEPRPEGNPGGPSEDHPSERQQRPISQEEKKRRMDSRQRLYRATADDDDDNPERGRRNKSSGSGGDAPQRPSSKGSGGRGGRSNDPGLIRSFEEKSGIAKHGNLRVTYRPKVGPFVFNFGRRGLTSLSFAGMPFLRFRLWSRDDKPGLSSIDLPGGMSYRGKSQKK